MEEERCSTGAWQAGYYNNEDGCVYHELCIPFQSFPPSLPPSMPLFPSQAHLSSSVCVLHLADRDLISTLLPRCYSLSREEGVFGCVCHPLLPPPPEAIPPPFVAKARCSYGGVMGCGIWAGEKEPLHDSALSLTGPLAITLHRPTLSALRLPSISLLFFNLPSSKRQRREKSNFQGTFFHASLCTSIHLSVHSRVPDQ